MSTDAKEQKDVYEVDGYDLYFVKSTDAFRLYGSYGARHSIQRVEALQDIAIGNYYHKLWTKFSGKTYELVEGEALFYRQHIDENGTQLGVSYSRMLKKGCQTSLPIYVAYALCLKAGAAIICRIALPFVSFQNDKHRYDIIKPGEINQELNAEMG